MPDKTFDETLQENYLAADALVHQIVDLDNKIGHESTAMDRRTLVRNLLTSAIAHRDDLKQQYNNF